MRTRRAILNVATSLLMQVVAVVCGFVVPIALIGAFGSETYGAIGSITQFLGFIALLEAGVGGVTRAALYKPLAEFDTAKINGIVMATESFFRRIGLVFVVYAFALALFFPYFTQYSGEWIISFLLTLVIGASTLAQYLFGITYSVLLQADQRSYINNFVQIVSYIANAVVVVVLVLLGLDVVIVQACSAAVYVLRPIVLRIYVRRRYEIRKTEPDNSAIEDRWNGLGHHLAFFFRSNISIVALSLFCPLSEVAVFTVYSLVANGLQKIVNAFSSGIEAAFGNMIAKNEDEALVRNFRVYELVSSTLVAVAFSTAAATILPFICVYTANVSDVNYSRPLFSLLLLASAAIYCFRLPYNTVVLAAGHYRQTRNGAFVEAGIAVGLSFGLVPFFGIEGAAIALLVATLVRTVQYGLYASKNVLHRPYSGFIMRALYVMVILSVVGVGGFFITQSLPVFIEGYTEWVLLALAFLFIACLFAALLILVFYRSDARVLVGKLVEHRSTNATASK